MSQRPGCHDDPDRLIDELIAGVGNRIVLGLPLGLGKANRIANALYRRTSSDRSLSLRIVTALTLQKPQPKTEMERRFIEPVIERLFGGYPDLAYARAMQDGTLPPNIQVNEFFFQAGAWLGRPAAQQSHISANYTHAMEYLLGAGVNVVAQLVAPDPDGGGDGHYSLSCNPDITLNLLGARAAGRADFRLVGEVNAELPFMPGAAVIPAADFSHVLHMAGEAFPLFAPPKQPVSLADHAIGLHVARLVPDGGTLQIGIGSIGDAVAQGLILRHTRNATFRTLTAALAPHGIEGPAIHDAPFEAGLYGASEMLVDSFLDLAREGVLKREVDGCLVHAGFFLGPQSFYRALRAMPAKERARFRMTAISFVNELYGAETAKRQARVKARFVNNAMMATLLGAVISDGLEDGRVVSGVGGQYNFVAQAFALDGARSIIALNATRRQDGRTVSNIRWRYGHETIPRHLRDVVVTEYGVADLRGRSDAEVIAAMLAVADSRFQDKLLAEAKSNGKIAGDYRLPAHLRCNTPRRLAGILNQARADGHLPSFPFGTDFTPVEQRLMGALQHLKSVSSTGWRLGRLLIKGLLAGPTSDDDQACLERMQLAEPADVKERAYRALLLAALGAERQAGSG